MNALKRDHGVSGYLDEMFTAKDVIHQALRAHAQVEKVVVGNDKTYKSLSKDLSGYISSPEASLNQNGLQTFCICCFSKNRKFKFVATVSKYSKKLSQRQDDILPSKFVFGGNNATLIENAKAELREVHAEVEKLRSERDDKSSKVEELQQAKQLSYRESEVSKKSLFTFRSFIGKFQSSKRKLADAKKALSSVGDGEEKIEKARDLMNRVMNSLSAIEAHSAQQQKILEAAILSTGAAAKKTSVATAGTMAE